MANWTAGKARAAFEIAPTAGLQDLTPQGPLVVVAPHPDDETLGCGGLIAEASATGRRVIVALMTDGAASHPNSPRYDPLERGSIRARELRSALNELSGGATEVATFGAPDGGLAERGAEAGRWLQGVVQEAGATALFVTWDADPHADHKAAFSAAEAAAAATGAALWAYPIWSLILPDDADVGARRRTVRLDIARHRRRKQEAIDRHASQLDGDVMADPEGFLLTTADIDRHTGDHELFLAIREPAQAAALITAQAARASGLSAL